MKLNNKGFAISTILYGLLVLIVLTTSLILGTMAFMRKNSKNFVDDVKKNLENTDTKSPTIEIIDFKVYVSNTNNVGTYGNENRLEIPIGNNGRICTKNYSNNYYVFDFEYSISVCDDNNVTLLNKNLELMYREVGIYGETSDNNFCTVNNFGEGVSSEGNCNIYKATCTIPYQTLSGSMIHPNSSYFFFIEVLKGMFEDDKHNITDAERVEYNKALYISASC